MREHTIEYYRRIAVVHGSKAVNEFLARVSRQDRKGKKGGTRDEVARRV